MNEERAGIVRQDENGFSFTYDENYSKQPEAIPVSLTLPIRTEPYRSKAMLPYFDNLIPEGWLLEIAEKNWQINPRDRMELLLTVCRDCIGAVSVQRSEINEQDTIEREQNES